MKRCSNCTKLKVLSAFSKGQRRCRACAADYYQKNKVRLSERAARLYAANREAYLTRNKKHYWDNRDATLVQQRAYRESNPIKMRAKSTRYYAQCREAILAKQRGGIQRLSDSYVRHTLTRETALSRADVPQSLVEAKREHLKIYRQLRSKSK